ncbi:MAG: hypothetical protein ACR2P3_00665 [Geminicoccaceae bacterium]
MSSILLVILIGVSIVSGQFAMAHFARGLEPPFINLRFVMSCLASPWFYTVGASYLISLIAYIVLLRQSSIIAANLPIMAIVVALNIIVGLTVGERVAPIQWLGVAFAIASITLLAGTRV